MQIIGDENLDQTIIDYLIGNRLDVYSISKLLMGASDLEVLEKAEKLSAILITEDKDFGELVFSHQIKSVSIIFLRYHKSELALIKQHILKVLTETNFNHSHKFITITAHKIRIKSL